MADKMRTYEDLKEMVGEEIDKIVKKDNMDEKCLEWLDKLVDIAKDVDTIFAMHEYGDQGGEGYSQMGRPYYSYDDGMTMPNNRSMNGRSYQRRDSMGRYADYRSGGYVGNGYSRDGDMRSKLEQMMNTATTEQEREAIRAALNHMNMM